MKTFKAQRRYRRVWAAIMLTAVSWPAHPVTLEKLLAYRVPEDVQISPDGQQAAFVLQEDDLETNSVKAGLWIVDIASSEVSRLDGAHETVSAPRWSPAGDRIAFLSDRGAASQIWTISASGGTAERALPDAVRGIRDFQWLPGGGFAYLAVMPPPGHGSATAGSDEGGGKIRAKRPGSGPVEVDKDPDSARLYEHPGGADTPNPLTPETRHVTSFNVSPDGEKVAYVGQSRPAPPYSVRAELRLLNLSDGHDQVLISQKSPISAPSFSPDGEWIAFMSQHEMADDRYHAMDNQHLQVISANGSRRHTPSESIDQDVLGFEWAGSGKSLYFWVNDRAANKAYRVGSTAGAPEPIRAFDEPKVLQRGDGMSFSSDGRIGVAAVSDAVSPVEVYALENEGRTLRKLTGFNESFAKLAPQTDLLSYTSFDGLAIEALVVKPRDFTPGTPHPLLVIVHGGPPGVFTLSFMPRIGAYPVFAFTHAGYVLLLPNPRGSTGYGEDFRKANFRDLGGGDFRDILAGVNELVEQGIADPRRLGLMGWSYGGYMAYWAVTHSTRFKAASAGAGITNLISHHGTGSARGYGQHDSIWQALPWEEPQLYIEHSPLFYVDRAETPILIQHGAADPIVPVSQAHEFYSAARRVGLPVQFVIYPGQPHMLQEPALKLDAMQRNLDWFNKWLIEEQR